MNYPSAITDFFKSPKWMMNLLLTGVCMLIPIVGPMVVQGWHIGGFWGRKDVRFETFPDFDFNQFGKYLERGLWPFLVTFVASIVMTPVLMIVLAVPMAISGFFTHGDHGFIAGLIGMVFSMAGYLFCLAVIMLVTAPLMLKATLTQDFGAAFDFAFVKRFVGLVWKELLIGAVFMSIAGGLMGMVGSLLFCVGMYFAIALALFGWQHILWQVYQLYLARGGEPVPVSPKLDGGSDLPPPAPMS